MPVLTNFDPIFRTPAFRSPAFRNWERLTDSLVSRGPSGSGAMPLDAYRHGDDFVVTIDLPGIDPGSVEVTVDKNVLSVSAERSWSPEDGDRVLVAERPQGRYSRRLRLGDNLDTDGIDARYDRGVLSLHIPVRPEATARRIPVATGAPVTVTGPESTIEAGSSVAAEPSVGAEPAVEAGPGTPTEA